LQRFFDSVVYGLRMRSVKREIQHQKADQILETVGLKGFEKKDAKILSGRRGSKSCSSKNLGFESRDAHDG
jgi:ABC-type proline/glycine betaine transport system ATPase subunit